MKTLNKLPALALALAAFVAPLASRASTGDIVDIRVVDTDEMTFGVRNSLAPNRCTADHPLVAGDDLYIRVRMLVTNYEDVIGGGLDPLTWEFVPTGTGSTLLTPKLGLMIGDRPAYAEFSETGYYPWQRSGALATDNAGNPSASWTYYTDLYFHYKVQAGDLGLPVRLMNSTGTGAAGNTDSNVGYYLLNCVSPNVKWVLWAQHLATGFSLSLVEDAGSTGLSSLASSASQPSAHEVPVSGGAACPQPGSVRACPHPQEAVSPPWSGLFPTPNPFLFWSLGPPFPQLPPQTLALSCVCSQAVWALNPRKPGTSFPQGGWLVVSMLLCKLFLRILFYSSTQ